MKLLMVYPLLMAFSAVWYLIGAIVADSKSIREHFRSLSVQEQFALESQDPDWEEA